MYYFSFLLHNFTCIGYKVVNGMGVIHVGYEIVGDIVRVVHVGYEIAGDIVRVVFVGCNVWIWL